jgi:hypothetical protein
MLVCIHFHVHTPNHLHMASNCISTIFIYKYKCTCSCINMYILAGFCAGTLIHTPHLPVWMYMLACKKHICTQKHEQAGTGGGKYCGAILYKSKGFIAGFREICGPEAEKQLRKLRNAWCMHKYCVWILSGCARIWLCIDYLPCMHYLPDYLQGIDQLLCIDYLPDYLQCTILLLCTDYLPWYCCACVLVTFLCIACLYLHSYVCVWYVCACIIFRYGWLTLNLICMCFMCMRVHCFHIYIAYIHSDLHVLHIHACFDAQLPTSTFVCICSRACRWLRRYVPLRQRIVTFWDFTWRESTAGTVT